MEPTALLSPERPLFSRRLGMGGGWRVLWNCLNWCPRSRFPEVGFLRFFRFSPIFFMIFYFFPILFGKSQKMKNNTNNSQNLETQQY